MPVTINDLSGRKKAAILLVALGSATSAELFRHMDDKEVEALSREIANLGQVPDDARRLVGEEFVMRMADQQFAIRGGLKFAREVLASAFGDEKAGDIVERVQAEQYEDPMEFLLSAEPSQLHRYLQEEHPQTIAVVLAHLRAGQAGQVLSQLPSDGRADVAYRIAALDRISPEVLQEVSEGLREQISSVSAKFLEQAGGARSLAGILNNVDFKTQKLVLEYLDKTDTELAEEVKRYIFTFDDMMRLDDQTIQKVLRDLDSKDLALAVKGASEDLRLKVYANMSERAAETLREDVELMGPVRLRSVEEAQQRVVAVIRQLEEAGEIYISRGEDEIVE